MSILFQVLPVIGNTIVIYTFIILLLRLIGHRQLSELSSTELVVVMVLGSSVEVTMVAGNVSLLAGLTSSATLLLCNLGFSYLLDHWYWLRKAVVGQPFPLVYKGQILNTWIKRAGMNESDVMEGIRKRGYEKVEDVHLAMLEIDGVISVISEQKEENDKKSDTEKK
jgi:uncharacterized membrane protein YcaP (DUF421 family)